MMKLKVNWQELGKALWQAIKPVILGAIGGGVIALTDGWDNRDRRDHRDRRDEQLQIGDPWKVASRSTAIPVVPVVPAVPVTAKATH